MSKVDARDAVVVGAGFGGLATALSLARAGARVTLCETLTYPGGCASTFERRGARFEAGATLFSGFGPGQPFDRWRRELGLDLQFDELDPTVVLRTPSFELPIPPERAAFVDRMVRLPGADRDAVVGFFREQERIADALWSLFDDPALLPPFGPRELLRHVGRLPRYLPLLELVGRPLEVFLRRHGLDRWGPLRTYADAVSQITVQASAAEAEAPFALATMDYYFRGTGHVHGGIGRLAQALVAAIRDAGGEVRFADRVKGLRYDEADGRWVVHARKGPLQAPAVAANLLPQDARCLAGLSEGQVPRLDRLARRVSTGWGAAMLYLVVRPDAPELDPAHHLEIVQDEGRPFLEGNPLFVSVSGRDETDRAPDGRRTVTVSTHVPAAELAALPDHEQAARVAAVQARMREGLRRFAPRLWAGVEGEMTGSPRTFARFTGRDRGLVGGVPRRTGLHHYLDVWPRPVLPGLYLVGDTVFPGQSTLATALGGMKLADHLLGTGTVRRGRRDDDEARSAPDLPAGIEAAEKAAAAASDRAA